MPLSLDYDVVTVLLSVVTYRTVPSASLTISPGTFSFTIVRLPPSSTLFPYTTLFRSFRTSASYAGYCRTVLDALSCAIRSEEHTSELQSLRHLVCRLLLGKKSQS